MVWVSQPQRGLSETLAAWTDHIFPAVKNGEFHLFGIRQQDTGKTAEQLAQANIILEPRATKEELADFYNSAKLLLYPGARDETFCLAAAEAQSMGVPVVTKGIGSLSERVEHNVNGLIAPTQEAFANAAINVLNDDALWSQLSNGGIKGRKQLSWDQVAKEWQRIIDPR